MWAMTGIGIGTVFTILLLLVLILGIFNVVAKKEKKTAAGSDKLLTGSAKTAAPALSASTAGKDDTSDDIAAVATALCLYFQEVHDKENFVLTIKHREHTAWHPES